MVMSRSVGSLCALVTFALAKITGVVDRTTVALGVAPGVALRVAPGVAPGVALGILVCKTTGCSSWVDDQENGCVPDHRAMTVGAKDKKQPRQIARVADRSFIILDLVSERERYTGLGVNRKGFSGSCAIYRSWAIQPERHCVA